MPVINVCFRFTKNLSADKISLSTLKGEGDLADLELDELVLTDLLDLPTWIRLTKASCNRLTIKVQPLLIVEVWCLLSVTTKTSSALMLLVRQQEGHPACKRTEW